MAKITNHKETMLEIGEDNTVDVIFDFYKGCAQTKSSPAEPPSYEICQVTWTDGEELTDEEFKTFEKRIYEVLEDRRVKYSIEKENYCE
ncbi:MAG: hypothetical protein KKC55_16080 [Gammaproteobacteria bacterium]|nr:hypothetical protein [Gammaproteobacteria bacterium]